MSAAVERCANCFTETWEVPCPHCGWVPGNPTRPPYIPVGTLLHNCYLVGRVLGHGGFGITYLGWDTNLDIPLAIKEYFPRSLATRVGDDLALTIFPGEKRLWFEDSLRRFQEEARILGKFKRHSSVVEVYSFFRANETCYMVMEYVAGVTLSTYLKHKGPLSYKRAYKILVHVMDALQAVHGVGLLHRDVSPHNIYITQDKQIKLLDFGAARFIKEREDDSSIIIKPGYAPKEQYKVEVDEQGPWTDVYGLAATFYHCLTGSAPPEVPERMKKECLIPPSMLGIKLPPMVEPAVIRGLSIEVAGRFQNIESFHQALPKPEPTDLPVVSMPISKNSLHASTPKSLYLYPLVTGIIVLAVVFVVLLWWIVTNPTF